MYLPGHRNMWYRDQRGRARVPGRVWGPVQGLGSAGVGSHWKNPSKISKSNLMMDENALYIELYRKTQTQILRVSISFQFCSMYGIKWV